MTAMMTLADARRKLDSLLVEIGKHIDGGVVVLEERTIAKPYGWIFFYNGKLFIETTDIMHAIAGNGPIVILAETGETILLGTARRPAEEIARFEHERSLMPRQQ